MFRRLAMILRKNDRIFIQKWGEWYLISNGYILVKANEDQYINFYSKYNSYVSTTNIPMNFDEMVVIQKEKWGDPVLFEYERDFSIFLKEIKTQEMENVRITNFRQESANKNNPKNYRIYKSQGLLGNFDTKHEFLFKSKTKCKMIKIEDHKKSDWLDKPIYLFDEDMEVYAMVLPVRADSLYEDIKGLVE